MQELLAKVPRNKELIFVDDSIVATLQPTKNCPYQGPLEIADLRPVVSVFYFADFLGARSPPYAPHTEAVTRLVR